MTTVIKDLEVRTSVAKMSRDLRTAAATLSDDEARYLVDAYYTMQDDRKRAYAQQRTLDGAIPKAEPSAVIGWLAEQSETLENQIKNTLDRYTIAHPMGSWMRGVVGIGPVISAGLLAHIDIEKAPTVGHIWQCAGIAGDGQKPWEKGKLRPFNAKLKTLCWKAGQSFMKFSGRNDCYYGTVYRDRKALEVANNTAGLFAAQAAVKVAKVAKTTDAYKFYSIGQLPPAHVDARARRYAVKLFLAHLHDAWYRQHFGKAPPLPYPIAILGHAHHIKAPA
jgi:hypothetical protein